MDFSTNEFDVPIRQPYQLFSHQIDAIKKLLYRFDNPVDGIVGMIIALEPGLAKTLVTLVSNMIFVKKDKNTRCLVIVPKTLLTEWENDIKKFFGSNIKYLIFHKDYTSNFENYTYEDICKYNIIITTYETAMSASKSIDEKDVTLENSKGSDLLYTINWDIITFDESHTFCNHKTVKYSSMMKLQGKRKILLSGSPLNNDITDLYSQFRVMGYNKITEPKSFNFYEYKTRNLMEFVHYKTYSDVGVVLPGIKNRDILLELEGEEKDIYDYYHNMTRKLFSKHIVNELEYIHVYNIFQRLRQICISPYTILPCSSRNEDFKESDISKKIFEEMPAGLQEWVKNIKGRSGIRSTKMKMMIKIIKSKVEKNEKTIVFSDSKRAIDIASKSLEHYLPDVGYRIIDGDTNVIKRKDIIDDFRNEKNVKVLFAIYKVGNVGLNLTQANNIIHLNNWWNPSIKKQADHRCYRTGQNKVVNIYNLIIKNTIEEKINTICEEKMKKIDECLRIKDDTKIDKCILGRILTSFTVNTN